MAESTVNRPPSRLNEPLVWARLLTWYWYYQPSVVVLFWFALLHQCLHRAGRTSGSSDVGARRSRLHFSVFWSRSLDGGFDVVLLSAFRISLRRAISAWSVLTISTSCSFDNWLSSSSLWCLDVRLFMCVIFSPRCTLCQVPPPESLREGDDKNLCIFFLLLANLIGIGRAVAKASNLTFLIDCSRIIKILSKMYSARLSWIFRCVW